MTGKIATTGLIAWLMTSTAYALTADQVWSGWQANIAALDGTLAAGETAVRGNATTFRNITITPPGGEPLVISEVTLTETADGAVTISLPPTLDFTPVLGAEETGSIKLSQKGFAVTVTEPAPNARNYAFAADTLGLAVSVTSTIDMFDGTPPKPFTYAFNFDLVALSGSYSDTPGPNRIFATDLKATTLAYTINQDDPFLDGGSKQNAVTQDLTLKGSVTMPGTFDMATMTGPEQMNAALRDGFAVAFDLTQGLTTSDQSMTSSFFSYGLKSESAGGVFAGSFDQTGFDLSIASQPATARITTPDLPIPFIDLAIGAGDMVITAPLVGAEMQDFRYKVKIDGISVNEEAWAYVDPTAILPRTPLNLDIDVTGKAAINIFDIIAAEERGDIPPVPK
ncbi:MAG: hypothetical protein ACRC6I_09560, partial [Paracoccaceae bacterium]